MPAFGKRVININIKPLMCGRINASVSEVKIMDLMSFFEVKADVGADFAVNIMPRRLSLDITMLTGENISDDTEKVHKDNAGNEILDIREYVSGDSLKTIHWKAVSYTHLDVYKRQSWKVVEPSLIFCLIT